LAKILQLDQENYDLWITYSWSGNNHGICGHTFEVIDYYFFLKDYFRVGILHAEDIDWEKFEKSVTNKYEVTAEEVAEMKSHTVFCKRPSLVRGNNILFTDGGVASIDQVALYFKNVFMFACGNKEIKNNTKENRFILQDERIYDKCFNGSHYVKKILFKKYKKIKQTECDDFLLYGTKNCRDIPMDMYEELLSKYPNNFICLTNKENRPEVELSRMQFVDMPVEDLFERFGTYVYTPVPRKFDCSPRFIAECKFYNKNVVFHNIDYWDVDRGLYWRNWDIENNFDGLYLDKGDPLVEFLKEKL
jgi:hypothetical protein